MTLNGIKLQNCWIASGALSFFGLGYWYDHLFRVAIEGFDRIDKMPFVAKTTTLHHHRGNMPLLKNYQPREWLPRCIKVYPFKGAILNAVGLSGPGAAALLNTGQWQNIERPFFLSFMAIGETAEDRALEIQGFCNLLKDYLPDFKSPVGLQINLSCPNTGHRLNELAEESLSSLRLARTLGIPLDIKVNTLFPLEIIQEIRNQGLCDILTIGNTAPYGSPGIDWNKISKSGRSPLSEYGGGGLSGKPILPLILRRIKELRKAGIYLPIKGGGGVLSESDVLRLEGAGADAIEIASVLLLRPWRIKSIIECADQLFK